MVKKLGFIYATRKDVLTEFWNDLYEQCTTGTNLKLPCLRHDFEARNWEAVAIILVMGWILQKVLHIISLASSLLKSCLYGMTSDHLWEEFLQFIPHTERKCISDPLVNLENVDQKELLEILSIHS